MQFFTGTAPWTYIDEAGQFLPPRPPRPLFSLVLSLIIPSAVSALARHMAESADRDQGQFVTEKQAAKLIRLVLPYEHASPVHRTGHQHTPGRSGEDFKNRQADAVTAHIAETVAPAVSNLMYETTASGIEMAARCVCCCHPLSIGL